MARKQIPKKKAKKKPVTPTWIAVGFDVSMTSIAGAAFGWDSTLRKNVGPVFVERRWSRGTDYFIRLREAASAAVYVTDLVAKLVMTPELHEIHIGIEEPVPLGMFKKGDSGWVKQQCQISGAFMGGLIRYGYVNISEVNNSTWKKPVSEDLGISVRDPNFKFAIKDWAMTVYDGVPDWPDLISHSKRGIIPRPEGSKAKAYQPDDRYDALGVMDLIKSEIEEGVIDLVSAAKAKSFPVQTP